MWWDRRSASTAARCAASRCWRSNSASRRAKYSSSFLLGLSGMVSLRSLRLDRQGVPPGPPVGLRGRGRRRLAAVAVTRPAQHGIHHLPVLQRDDVLGAAAVFAPVTEEEIGPFTLVAHRDRRAPQRVDVLLAHSGRDGTRVHRAVPEVAGRLPALRGLPAGARPFPRRPSPRPGRGPGGGGRPPVGPRGGG